MNLSTGLNNLELRKPSVHSGPNRITREVARFANKCIPVLPSTARGLHTRVLHVNSIAQVQLRELHCGEGRVVEKYCLGPDILVCLRAHVRLNFLEGPSSEF